MDCAIRDALMAPFASLKKIETLFRLICCEKKNTVPTEKTSWKIRIIRPAAGSSTILSAVSHNRTRHNCQHRNQQNIEQITMRNNYYPSAHFYYHVMLDKNYIKRLQYCTFTAFTLLRTLVYNTCCQPKCWNARFCVCFDHGEMQWSESRGFLRAFLHETVSPLSQPSFLARTYMYYVHLLHARHVCLSWHGVSDARCTSDDSNIFLGLSSDFSFGTRSAMNCSEALWIW